MALIKEHVEEGHEWVIENSPYDPKGFPLPRQIYKSWAFGGVDNEAVWWEHGHIEVDNNTSQWLAPRGLKDIDNVQSAPRICRLLFATQFLVENT